MPRSPKGRSGFWQSINKETRLKITNRFTKMKETLKTSKLMPIQLAVWRKIVELFRMPHAYRCHSEFGEIPGNGAIYSSMGQASMLVLLNNIFTLRRNVHHRSR